MTLQSQQPLHREEPEGALPPHPLEVSHTTLALEGMTCASCAIRIEKGLKRVPGVLDASVNLATERGTVTYDPSLIGIEQLLQKVEAVGYKAAPLLAPKATPAGRRPRAAGDYPQHVLHEPLSRRESAATGAHHARLGHPAGSFTGELSRPCGTPAPIWIRSSRSAQRPP